MSATFVCGYCSASLGTRYNVADHDAANRVAQANGWRLTWDMDGAHVTCPDCVGDPDAAIPIHVEYL